MGDGIKSRDKDEDRSSYSFMEIGDLKEGERVFDNNALVHGLSMRTKGEYKSLSMYYSAVDRELIFDGVRIDTGTNKIYIMSVKHSFRHPEMSKTENFLKRAKGDGLDAHTRRIRAKYCIKCKKNTHIP